MASTILIVDDDVALSRLYQETLAAEGFSTLVERDAEGALGQLRQTQVDLVVLDALLPGTTGFELAEMVRRLPRGAEVKLLFVSGVFKAARHRADVVDQFGALDFLEKPLAPRELADRVRQALGAMRPPPQPPAILSGMFQVPAILKGDLSQRPFHDVLAELARTRQTGQLSVRREKVKKIVHLRDGDPVHVKSNLLSECLGRVLVQVGLLTDAQCEASLERMRVAGCQQGQALVELGFLDEDAVGDALLLQLEQKLFDVFAWESGEFQFVPRADEGQPLLVTSARALQDGLARAWTEDRLVRELGDADALAVRVLPDALPLVATMRSADFLGSLARAADGTHSITRLLELNIVGQKDALALFVALRALRQAEVIPAPPGDAAANLIARHSQPPAPGASVGGWVEAAKRLGARVDELDRLSHYEVLGVPRSASAQEVHKAYVALARDHHPDKHYGAAPVEVRQMAERIFARLTTAHDALVDPEERARYDAGHPETAADRSERILRADEAFRAGRRAFERGGYAEAAAALREAVEGYPDEALFHAWHGLALWQAHPEAPGAAERALEHLHEARRRDPKLAEAQQFARHVRRAAGLEETPATAEQPPASPAAGAWSRAWGR